MSSALVDSAESVCKLLEAIETSVLKKPLIFVDLEGINLSRHGSICILQILVPPKPVVYLVDVFVMKHQAFETAIPSGLTLKAVLESSEFAKVFFDVRNDSDALHAHYGIKLQSVIDLQLIEFATRPRRGRFVKGLAKCISEDGELGYAAVREWNSVKDAGAKLFAPEKGGRYEVFQERPLSTEIANYCAQDVLNLPLLLKLYAAKLNGRLPLAGQIGVEAIDRVKLSQSSYFNGKGRHMAIGPTFTAGRSSGPALEFPMSLVCSSSLSQYCSLNKTVDEKPRSLNDTATHSDAEGYVDIGIIKMIDEMFIGKTPETLEGLSSPDGVKPA